MRHRNSRCNIQEHHWISCIRIASTANIERSCPWNKGSVEISQFVWCTFSFIQVFLESLRLNIALWWLLWYLTLLCLWCWRINSCNHFLSKNWLCNVNSRLFIHRFLLPVFLAVYDWLFKHSSFFHWLWNLFAYSFNKLNLSTFLIRIPLTLWFLF